MTSSRATLALAKSNGVLIIGQKRSLNDRRNVDLPTAGSWHAPNRQRCVICQTPLSVHEVVRGDVCGNASCQQVRLRQQLQKKAEQRQQTLQLAAQQQRQLLANAIRDEADAAPIILLPANQRPLVNLPEKRQRRFRDYFMRSLSIAAARRASQFAREAVDPNEEGENQFPVVKDPNMLAVLAGACGICRGLCCEQGGEHAFQRPEVIRRYMDQHPHLRPRELLDAYLSRLPTLAYRDACVFQGRHGCVLPQSMRSRTCNEYLCNGLQEIHRVAKGSGNPQVFVAAIDADRPVRSALLSINRPSDR